METNTVSTEKCADGKFLSPTLAFIARSKAGESPRACIGDKIIPHRCAMSSKQLTIYAPIIPGQDPSGHDRTGIFFPDKYVPGATVDLILCFHGLLDRCGGSASDTVEKYWTNKYFRLRELVNNSNKNVVLVVPRLGGLDKNYSKLGMEGDDFLKNILA
ncbi:MAG TPA: hypothetical protein VKI65_06060, partial [Gemmataceae bacterium]|nr:hypothetical protein [Gemmataceae bacterium]